MPTIRRGFLRFRCSGPTAAALRVAKTHAGRHPAKAAGYFWLGIANSRTGSQ